MKEKDFNEVEKALGKTAVVIMLPALNVGVKRLGEAILRAVDMAKDDGKKEALS